jgi:hypothetical protein
MAITIIDIIIIILVVVLIAAIIIINITSFINKKLTDITVNIPPFEVPDPNITVKIQKNCTVPNATINKSSSVSTDDNNEDEYNIYVEKNNPKNYSIAPIIETKNEIENFSSIGINKNKLSKVENIQYGYTLKPNSENCLSGQRIVQENNNSMEQILDEQYNRISPEAHIITPEIKSILNNRKINKKFLSDAYKYMVQNGLYTEDQFEKEKLEFRRKYNDEDDIDPTEWFKKFQEKTPSYLEDPKTRGYNINKYDNVGNIYSVGRIKLRDNVSLNPKPNGYVFDNSTTNLQ